MIYALIRPVCKMNQEGCEHKSMQIAATRKNGREEENGLTATPSKVLRRNR